MHEDEEEVDPRSLIRGSRELQIQLVLTAFVVMIFGLVTVILPLLFTPPDPVIALIFALLLGASGAFLGGAIIYGYFKARVGAEARMYAEEMVDEALNTGEARKSMEELFVEEKERLQEQLESEKQEYFNQLQEEFNKRLDEEENTLMSDVRAEFEKQLSKEKQSYIDRIDADLRQGIDREKRAYEDAVRAEYDRRFEEEKNAFEKQVSEFDQQKDAEKKAYGEQLISELKKAHEGDKKAFEESLRTDLELRFQGEKQAYTDIVKRDFEEWKKEFTGEFRKEIMRDVPPAAPPQPAKAEKPKPEAAPPWVGKEKPPQAKKADDLSDIFQPAAPSAGKAEAAPEAQAKDEKDYDFRGLNARDQLAAAVELLQGGRDRSTFLTFRNSKTRRFVALKARGREIYMEAPVEEISIKCRLMLREFAAQNKLPMEKNDDTIRVMFGSDPAALKANIGEAVGTAFSGRLEDLSFDVKIDHS